MRTWAWRRGGAGLSHPTQLTAREPGWEAPPPKVVPQGDRPRRQLAVGTELFLCFRCPRLRNRFSEAAGESLNPLALQRTHAGLSFLTQLRKLKPNGGDSPMLDAFLDPSPCGHTAPYHPHTTAWQASGLAFLFLIFLIPAPDNTGYLQSEKHIQLTQIFKPDPSSLQRTPRAGKCTHQPFSYSK